MYMRIAWSTGTTAEAFGLYTYCSDRVQEANSVQYTVHARSIFGLATTVEQSTA